MAKRNFNPAALDIGQQDRRWIDERLVQEEQRRRYKSFTFWGVTLICATLYGIFFKLLWLLFTNTLTMQMFLAHTHLLGLVIALLLVPSAMLWGLVRAVFKIDNHQGNYVDTAKAAMSLYPPSGV